MTDLIIKIIGLLLAFVLLVLVPVTIVRMTDEMATKRIILNEVGSFIDRVTDKGNVTPTDIDDLYMAINSRGGAFDALVTRYVRFAIPSDTYGVESVYIASDDSFGEQDISLHEGDVIQVRITCIERTGAQQMLWFLFRLHERDFEFALAGTVR